MSDTNVDEIRQVKLWVEFNLSTVQILNRPRRLQSDQRRIYGMHTKL